MSTKLLTGSLTAKLLMGPALLIASATASGCCGVQDEQCQMISPSQNAPPARTFGGTSWHGWYRLGDGELFCLEFSLDQNGGVSGEVLAADNEKKKGTFRGAWSQWNSERIEIAVPGLFPAFFATVSSDLMVGCRDFNNIGGEQSCGLDLIAAR